MLALRLNAALGELVESMQSAHKLATHDKSILVEVESMQVFSYILGKKSNCASFGSQGLCAHTLFETPTRHADF